MSLEAAEAKLEDRHRSMYLRSTYDPYLAV